MIHALIVLVLVSQQPNSAAPSRHLVVTGTVLDDRNHPIERARIFLSQTSEDDGREHVVARGETDAEGRFRVETRERVNFPLVGFVLSMTLWTRTPGLAIAASRVPFDKDPTFSGIILKNRHEKDSLWTVLGPDGEPVAEARIGPAIIRINGLAFVVPEELRDEIEFRTDDKGKTTIQGLDVGSIASIRVESKSFGRQFGPPPTTDSPIVLSPVASVKGRLIADDRSSLIGRYFLISTQSDNLALKFQSGEALVVTDSQGRFEVPAITAGESTIREVRISSNDSITEYPIIKRSIEPGNVSLEIKAIAPWGDTRSGTVVDRNGDPVADAEVFTRGDTVATISTKTDRDGRFTLKGVPRSRFFVFVKKQGYRFGGAIVSKGEELIDLRIAKSDEAPIAPMKTLDPPISQAARIELARKVLDPSLRIAMKNGSDADLIRFLETLARIDPDRALGMSEQKKWMNPKNKYMIYRSIAVHYAPRSIEKSIAIVDQIEPMSLKLKTYTEIVQKLTSVSNKTKHDLLNRMTKLLEQEKETWIRVMYTAEISKQRFEIGEDDVATKALSDLLEEARKLSSEGAEGSAREAFAEALCLIDLPAALELIAKLPDRREFNGSLGNIAHVLAGRSSADAERVLSMLTISSFRDDCACRVCYRMASIDLPRARKIAASIADKPLRAYAIGVMADKLSETDKTEAKKLLDAAFDTLDSPPQPRPPASFGLINRSPSVVAACLIPVAEKIDPSFVSEYYWKTVSLRYQMNLKTSINVIGRVDPKQDPSLSVLLSRFDRTTARLLIDPIDPQSIRDSSRFMAAVELDPSRALEYLAIVREPDTATRFDLKNLFRKQIAERLVREGSDHWRYIMNRELLIWMPDIVGVDPFL